MDYAWIIVGGIVIFGLISWGALAPGRALAAKFVGMGTLRGKTRAEIERAAGAPTSVSQLGDGKVLLQWMATGYHIALRFDGDQCEGVTHESQARQ